ncbi:MAG: winged helix-turn-helix transcriptional regulator [Terrimonas ferruginea]|nr:winged helix-turn-helix transcriptional regulator [Terrimonas ferruginea]
MRKRRCTQTVEYTLAAKGEKLEPIINELYKWCVKYVG